MTANVKKAFQPMIDLLNANLNKPVSEVIAQIVAMAETKINRTTGEVALYDTKGKAVALYDYHLARWMPLVGTNAVEFGPKANTATGYQGMSKIGLSLWTSAQRVAKTAELNLLKQVASGEIQPSDIVAKQAEIETTRRATPTVDTKGEPLPGYSTIEEVKAYLTECKVKLGDGPAPVKADDAATNKKAA